jgi:hypothetical protein
MKLKISKDGAQFVVDDPTVPGSPVVGRGRTMKEAIGDYFHGNQTKLGLSFDVDETAHPAEMRRRSRELSRR